MQYLVYILQLPLYDFLVQRSRVICCQHSLSIRDPFGESTIRNREICVSNTCLVQMTICLLRQLSVNRYRMSCQILDLC